MGANRNRPAQRGMARYEVLGLDADRKPIRALAKRLAENDAEAIRLRAKMSLRVTGEAPKKGGILAALRRSPLVGADLEIAHDTTPGRKIGL